MLFWLSKRRERNRKNSCWLRFVWFSCSVLVWLCSLHPDRPRHDWDLTAFPPPSFFDRLLFFPILRASHIVLLQHSSSSKLNNEAFLSGDATKKNLPPLLTFILRISLHLSPITFLTHFFASANPTWEVFAPTFSLLYLPSFTAPILFIILSRLAISAGCPFFFLPSSPSGLMKRGMTTHRKDEKEERKRERWMWNWGGLGRVALREGEGNAKKGDRRKEQG